VRVLMAGAGGGVGGDGHHASRTMRFRRPAGRH